jgi:hypothetical protein
MDADGPWARAGSGRICDNSLESASTALNIKAAELFMSSRTFLLLFAFITFSLAFCLCAKPANPSSPGQDVFQFWYEPWQPESTLKKLSAATVIVGVPASYLPEIHKSGRRALQYVTYYQTHFKTAFLKDQTDLARVGFESRGQSEKSAFGGRDNYVLCPNSIELKARVLNYLEGTLKAGFDGYFVDNTFVDPQAHQVCDASHPHIKPGVQGGRAYLDLLVAIREKMKQQNPSAILVSNPGSGVWADQIASGRPTLWDVSDYVVWESYGYSSLTGANHDRWKSTIEQSFKYASAPDKASKILTLSYPQNLAEARFAFAIARTFGFTWSANLGENARGTNEKGGHFGVFLNDIPFDVGEPLSPLPDPGSSLLHRTFAHGEIFVNCGKTAQNVSPSVTGTLFLGDSPGTKLASRQIDLAPMTSAIILKM